MTMSIRTLALSGLIILAAAALMALPMVAIVKVLLDRLYLRKNVRAE